MQFDPNKSYTQQGNEATSAMASGAMDLASVMPNLSRQNRTAQSTPQQKFSNLSTNIGNLGSVTTPYGGSTKFEKFHPGVDIANKIGTPIPSFGEGTVIGEDTGKVQGDKGFGNTVLVKDAQGNIVRYSHLNKAFVKVGDKIGKGTEVGEMGNSGSTYSQSGTGTGSHLDLRIKNAYGKYINPLAYLRGLKS